MMQWHDTLRDLKHGTPVWFTLAAWMLPVGIGAQFLIAGGALFQDPRFWDLHGMLGGLLAIPVLIGMVGAIVIRRLRGFGWWAGVILALYGVQLALAAEAKPVPLAFHPFNAALLLSASLVQLAKVQRRRDLIHRNRHLE